MDKQTVLIKEIDLIQSCINRMAQNSFYVKGWTISLIAVVLALLPERFDMRGLCLICLVIVLCFWYLDAFFLKIEKLYRWKYEWVIANRLSNEEYFYDLNPYNKNMWIQESNVRKQRPSIIKCMLSKTLFPLYATLFVFSLLFLILSFCGLV